MRNCTIVFLSVFCAFVGVAQQHTTGYLMELQTTQSSTSSVPFWLSANTHGRIQENPGTMLYGLVWGEKSSGTSELFLSYKVGATAYSALENAVFIDELNGTVAYKKLGVTIGVQHDAVQLGGLSSSNGTITKSTNARAYPGYKFYLKDFVTLPFAKKWLSVKGSYGDFLLKDKRSVDGAKLHEKSLFINYQLSKKWTIITGLNHYAIWAGASEIYGKQPSSFKDYLRVISGSSGGDAALETDQINVIGSQLGSYQFELNYKGEKAHIKGYWSHIFEDRSGRELMNYPDALYGVFVDFKKSESVINQLLMEFTYTKHASGSSPHYVDENGVFHAASGMDNYFNNGVYQTGWTYFGNTIGSPYFTPKPTDADGITRGIIDGDNRFMAFNVGMNGCVKNIPYKLLLSHSTYFGWFGKEYNPKPTQFSGLLEVNSSKIIKSPFIISVGTAFDTGTYRPVNFGGFVKLSKKGLF